MAGIEHTAPAAEETAKLAAIPARVSAAHSHRLTSGVFIAAILLLAGIAALGYYSALQTAANNRWVDHTYQVMLAADKMLVDQQDTAAGSRGYLLTGRQTFLDQYRHGRDQLGPDTDAIARLTADNPVQQARIARIRPLNAERVALVDRLLASRRPRQVVLDFDQAGDLEESKGVMDQIHSILTDIQEEEEQLLAVRYADTERTGHTMLLVIVFGNLVSLGALVLCLFALNREIRNRRQAELEARGLNATLDEQNSLLELTNRELEGFNYSISHDLRAPLRAIDGYSMLLERGHAGTLDPEGLRLLSVVRDSSKRMGTLIEDLLSFSRLGRKPVHAARLDMQPLVAECVAEVLHGAAVKPEVTVGWLPACSGDRALLKQVWLNLVGNAVKYSSHTPNARVEIMGRETPEEWVYSVRDNGAGFDMQYYDKLFGVFQRLHAVEEFPGTGVGLAIVMRVVTKHGGRVWAEAAVGKGATFHFSIPRREHAV